MKKKWVIGKEGQKRCCSFFRKVLAAAFAAIFVGLACNSSVSVERNGRLYEQQINCLKTVIRLKIPICSRTFCPKKSGE